MNNPSAHIRETFKALLALRKNVNMDQIAWKDIKADLGKPLNFSEVDLNNLSGN